MRFGRYQLVEKIGSGGMAEVYRAVVDGADPSSSVAIKLMRQPLCGDPTWVQMFVDEARLMSELHHPNIVQVFDLGEVDGLYFIAMEYVHGRDLGWLIDTFQGPIPISIGIYIALEICRGLSYAHNLRDSGGQPLTLVHRDVSPPNVLVSWEGAVKLADFGIAKARRRAVETTQGKIKGKFGYMAPEQVRGEPLDQRTDLFALGALMHELFTGKALFQADSAAQTIRRVIHGAVHPPSRENPLVPPEVDAVVLRALSREAPMRYQSADALHGELMACARATTGTLLTSDLAAWMQGRLRAQQEQEQEHPLMGDEDDEDSQDTRIERVVAGRLHGLLSRPHIQTLAPEPSLAQQGLRPPAERGGAAGADALLPGVDDSPSTVRVPKMAERPLRDDTLVGDGTLVSGAAPAAEFDDDHDAATRVSLDDGAEIARTVARLSPPLGVPVTPTPHPLSSGGAELDSDEATRVHFGEAAQPLDATVRHMPAMEEPPLQGTTQGLAAEFQPIDDDEELGLATALDAPVAPSAPMVASTSSRSELEELHRPFDSQPEIEGDATAVSLAALDEAALAAADAAAAINSDYEPTTNVVDPVVKPRERSETKRLPEMEVIVPQDEVAPRGRNDTLPSGMPATPAEVPQALDDVLQDDYGDAGLYAFDSDDDPTEAMPAFDPSMLDGGGLDGGGGMAAAERELPAEAYPSAEVLVDQGQLAADQPPAREAALAPAAPIADARQTPPLAGVETGAQLLSAMAGAGSESAAQAEQVALAGTVRDVPAVNGIDLKVEGADEPAYVETRTFSKVWRWVGFVMIGLMLVGATVGAYFLYKRQQARRARREANAKAAALLKEKKLEAQKARQKAREEKKKREAARKKAAAASRPASLPSSSPTSKPVAAPAKASGDESPSEPTKATPMKATPTKAEQ